MRDKVTSIRIKEEVWREAKILAIKDGITLKQLIEELLESVISGNRWTEKLQSNVQEDILEVFRSKRRRRKLPFKIIHEKMLSSL